MVEDDIKSIPNDNCNNSSDTPQEAPTALPSKGGVAHTLHGNIGGDLNGPSTSTAAAVNAPTPAPNDYQPDSPSPSPIVVPVMAAISAPFEDVEEGGVGATSTESTPLPPVSQFLETDTGKADQVVFDTPVELYSRKKKNIIIYSAVAVVVVLCAIIGGVVVSMKNSPEPEPVHDKVGVSTLTQELTAALDKSFDLVKEAYGGRIPSWKAAETNEMERKSTHFRAVKWCERNKVFDMEGALPLIYFSLASFFFGAGGFDGKSESGELHNHGWQESDGWLNLEEFPNHCDWKGIKCYNDTDVGTIPGIDFDSIAEIDINHMNIKGTLVPEIFLIPKLMKFSAWTNEFTGPIPSAIGLAKDLEVLDMEFNQFSGTIPEEIYGLRNLRKMWLGSNKLTGTLSNKVSQLKFLQNIHVYVNQLTGTIPKGLFSLEFLDDIDLIINKFEGTFPYEAYENPSSVLHYVGISDNNLEGSIPSTISNLKKLEAFHISKNKFTGSIPEEIGECKLLREMRIFENELTGTIPEAFYNLPNLEDVSFSQNRFEGTISSSIGKLSSLRSFWAHRNDFSGTLPSTVGNLTELRELYLHKNNFIGQIPEDFGDIDTLWKLYLWGNKLSGPIPDSIYGHPSISEINLSENELTGTIPEIISYMGNVSLIQLEHNKLFGKIPEALGRLNNLDILHLQSNQLTGSVPELICNLDQLSQFETDCTSLVECSCCTLCCGEKVCVDPETGEESSSFNRRLEVTDRVMSGPGSWSEDF